MLLPVAADVERLGFWSSAERQSALGATTLAVGTAGGGCGRCCADGGRGGLSRDPVLK